jgi:cytochrome c oxidase subunit 1
MATHVAPVPLLTTSRVAPEARGWTSWITTTDHKRIGIMYMVTTFVFFCLGSRRCSCACSWARRTTRW